MSAVEADVEFALLDFFFLITEQLKNHFILYV